MTAAFQAIKQKFGISIHTPARGVTMIYMQNNGQVAFISIHTPARGVTRINTYINDINSISIHTPARGVTKS